MKFIYLSVIIMVLSGCQTASGTYEKDHSDYRHTNWGDYERP